MRKISSFSILVIAFISFVVVIVGCENQEKSREEKLKAITHRVIEEALGKFNMDVVDEYFASEFVFHMPPDPDTNGLEVYKQHLERVQRSFPDNKLPIEEIIVEGDKVVVQLRWQATHTGYSPLLGSPTGKKVNIPGCIVYKWKDNKIVEGWEYWDNQGFYEQYGYTKVPPSGPDDARDVWKMEEQYWQYFRNCDLEGYMTLIQDDFVGWPHASVEPVKKNDLKDLIGNFFMTTNKDSYSFNLKPHEVQLFGNIAVAYYLMNNTWENNDGSKESRLVRYTHTWMKEEGTWKIIGGMSNIIHKSIQ